MGLDNSNPDLTANDASLDQCLNDADQSQPTPCNSHESSPGPAPVTLQDDSVMEPEASHDELDELDCDESTKQSMETSQESHTLHCQLQAKQRQVKKAEKQARIQHLCSQLAETDHQLEVLHKRSAAQPGSSQGSSVPIAPSTPKSTAQQEQSWLQQADLNAADNS